MLACRSKIQKDSHTPPPSSPPLLLYPSTSYLLHFPPFHLPTPLSPSPSHPSTSFLPPPTHLSHEDHNQHNDQNQEVSSCPEEVVVRCHGECSMRLLLRDWTISGMLKRSKINKLSKTNVMQYDLLLRINNALE